MSIYKPSTLDALKYNFMYVTGNLFGLGGYLGINPTNNIDTYKWLTDVYDPDGKNWQDALGKVLFPVNGATNDFDGQMNAVYVTLDMIPVTVDASTAETGNAAFNLFGLLPWDAIYLQNSEGDWVGMHGWGSTTPMMYNPLRREVLARKLKSLAILGGIGAASFYGGRYLFRRYRNKI